VKHVFCRGAKCPLMCRFSDAGSTDLTTRSAGRRPKSAKARNRVGRQWDGGAAGERCRKQAMGIWAREQQWQAEKVMRAEMILQCSQCERVGANERAVGCAGCLRVQLCAN
jgi:hypothetical protein